MFQLCCVPKLFHCNSSRLINATSRGPGRFRLHQALPISSSKHGLNIPEGSTGEFDAWRRRAHPRSRCELACSRAASDQFMLTPRTVWTVLPKFQVRDANVVAALSIANVVKSSLGPVGLDKSGSPVLVYLYSSQADRRDLALQKSDGRRHGSKWAAQSRWE